jgi:hypothetical protein
MMLPWIQAGSCGDRPGDRDHLDPAVQADVAPHVHQPGAGEIDAGCLVDRKAFTVNVPSRRFARETDFFGRATGRTTDKFAATGLTAVRSDLVDAPYVGEFPMVLECALRHTLEIGLHTLFVGEILDIRAAAEVLDDTGRPAAEKVDPISYAPGAGRYHALGDDLGEAGALGRDLLDASSGRPPIA